jgi:hypothetical protein
MCISWVLAVVNLSLLAVQAGLGPGCPVLGKTVPDKSRRRNKPPGGKPLRVGNVVQVEKNVFLKFFWRHWAKNARGDVTKQVLSTCLAKSNGEGCTAEKLLRFLGAVLLGGHCLEVYWCGSCSSNDIATRLGGRGGETKNLQQHFLSQKNTACAH